MAPSDNLKTGFILLSVLFGLSVKSQPVSKDQQHHEIKNYITNNITIESQNWNISQSPKNGMVYFANSDGLVEYNGISKKIYHLPHRKGVRSVFADKHGNIFTGTFEDFGFWNMDPNGHLTYHSLTANFTIEKNDEIWKIYGSGDKIYFQSFTTIYSYDYKTIVPVKSPFTMLFMFQVGERFIVQVLGTGLYWFDGKKFDFIPGSELFVPEKVHAIVEYSSSELLICTANQGIYKFSGHQFNYFNAPVSAFLKAYSCNAGLSMNDSLMIFGTILNGVVFTDKKGQILRHYNFSNGLNNNTVLSLTKDADNGLWVGLDEGVNYIDTSSPYTYYTNSTGTLGTIYTVLKDKDLLYMGTNHGLFVADIKKENNFYDFTNIRLIPNSQGQVWVLEKFDNQILCGHNEGTFLVEGNLLQQISNITGGWCIKQYNDLLIEGTYINDTIFAGPEKSFRIDSASLNHDYWESNRLVPLTKSEKQIYTTVDSLNNMKAFRRRMDIVTAVISGFLNLGDIEIGTISSFYSYNPVEGSRIRFGGRTSTDFSKKLTLDGYMAYGTKDNKIKYNAGITYSLTPRTIYQFPVRYIKASYQKDVRIPGQDIQYWQVDNILLSFKRGINDKLFMNNQFKLEYLQEFENHFSYHTGYLFNKQYTHGNLKFYASPPIAEPEEISNLNISELFLNLRFAPNESFYQGKMYRTSFPNKHPIIQLRMAAGSSLIGNDYDYLRLQLNISRRYYLSILGYTDIAFDAGKVFGKVPYPLLFLHPANQTYSYQKYSYNLMNFLEFVSDKYASINIDHSFNGFILNKVPLIKQLKLRELLTFKAVYGSLNIKNNPYNQKGLINFPTDENGIPLTYTLENKPYIEAGVGLSNIFRLFRIDFIQRFTYTNNPNVDKSGFRVQFRLDI